MHAVRIILVVVSILVLFQPESATQFNLGIFVEPDKKPSLIRQGPTMVQASSGLKYWFQAGAIGTSASSNYAAANITIRTVYDKVNNDGHSYWIGGYLSNGAFIQVGYLNEVSTAGEQYCCAWFYEYFPANDKTCCDPVIGREGSAGPIGNWHTYSMLNMGPGTWSFYMDGSFLGSTVDLGASTSGSHAPAGVAEVAWASTNLDILGPAEFRNMMIRGTAGWQQVQAADSFIWYGEGTPTARPSNPYGVVEVTGVNNDFLAGTGIPQLASPSPNPGPSLWPVPNLPSRISFSFLDADSGPLSPDWVSLRTSTSRIYFTDYQNYQNMGIGNGAWILDQVIWHSVNVAGSESPVSVPSMTSLSVRTRVFSVRLLVMGAISTLPVGGASIITFLPDTSNATAKTGSGGVATLAQLPQGTYNVHISVPFGIPTTITRNVQESGDLTARVIGLAEIFMIIITPIAIAVLATILAVRRQRLRTVSMPTIPPPGIAAGNCPSCGTLFLTTDLFCLNCRLPVRTDNPPPPSLPS